MLIWIATWNCENQAPDDTMLGDFINNEVNALPVAQKPDFIVIALQEAVNIWKGDFVSQRLAKTKRLGNDYTHLASSWVMGITKGTKNYLQVGVLAKNGAVVTNNSTNSYREGMEGKGGAYVKFRSGNRSLGFIGAHLDSRNNTHRNSQIKGLLAKITGNDPATVTDQNLIHALVNQFDVLFFMGDLNYRLTAGGQINQGITVEQIVKKIATPAGRVQLWAQDTLPNSPLVATYGFNFPALDHLLPTYKREYTDKVPCTTLSTLLGAQPINLGPSQQGFIEGCYFKGIRSDVAVPYNVGRQAFDVGWLDRIGYRDNGNHVQNAPTFHSYDNLVLSDHTPLLMKVTVV